MADYIKRQDAVDALDGIFDNVPMELTTEILRLRRELRGLPPADVAPVVHGRWVKKKDSGLFYCSECDLPSMHKWQYCERCGAKMDGKRQADEIRRRWR